MMITWIEKMFKHAFEREWYETFWSFDIHGTILVPTFRKYSKDTEFYPWAKETLQLLSERKDIVLIMDTSSYPAEIEHYLEVFKENGIHFDFINENPKVSSNLGNFGYYEKKFYFNCRFDDKAGFDPLVEWKQIYDLLIEYNRIGYLPNPNWTIKY